MRAEDEREGRRDKVFYEKNNRFCYTKEKILYNLESLLYEDEHLCVAAWGLRPEFTLDNWKRNDKNMNATMAAYLIGTCPEIPSIANIYGEKGTGKTHLLHAIGNEIIGQIPRTKLLCVSATEFIEDVHRYYSIKKFYDELDFFYKYFTKDVLLMDDASLIEEDMDARMFFELILGVYLSQKKILVVVSRDALECMRMPELLKNSDTYFLEQIERII